METGSSVPDSIVQETINEIEAEIRDTGRTTRRAVTFNPLHENGVPIEICHCDIWDGAPGYTNPLTGAASQIIGYGKDGFDNNNWICDHDGSKNKKWELKGDVTPGLYYVEGNLYVPGDLGTADDPQVISLVAEGFLEISGNPYIVPHYDTQVDTVDQLSAASLDEMASIDPGLTYNDVLALDAMFLNDEILLHIECMQNSLASCLVDFGGEPYNLKCKID